MHLVSAADGSFDSHRNYNERGGGSAAVAASARARRRAADLLGAGAVPMGRYCCVKNQSVCNDRSSVKMYLRCEEQSICFRLVGASVFLFALYNNARANI
jgi:hypothetical protein